MITTPTINDIRRALALKNFDARSAWQLMTPRPRLLERPADKPGNPRRAGVLILLYRLNGELALVLTQRSDALSSHAGQVSLPGGSIEHVDNGSTQQAALREACEEVGVCDEDVQVLGSLTPLYIFVSDFDMHPYVGYVPQRPSFVPDPVEVARVIDMPLTALLDPSKKEEERWTLRDSEFDVPFYRLNDVIVWGATAIVLSEFEQRLRTTLKLR